MALTKQVVLSQMEILPNGTIQVRLSKQVLDNDVTIASEYHRFVLEPGANLNDIMSNINTHLAQMGWPACRAADVARVRAVAGLEHTPAAILAFITERNA